MKYQIDFLSSRLAKPAFLTAREMILVSLGLLMLLALISINMSFDHLKAYWLIKQVNAKNTLAHKEYQLVANKHPLLAGPVPLIQRVNNLKTMIQTKQKTFDAMTFAAFRRGFSHYMHAFATTVPEGLWLNDFVIEQGNRQMSLRGFLMKPDELPQFLQNLVITPLFKDVSFDILYIHSFPEKPYREFKIATAGMTDDKEKKPTITKK